MQFENTKYPLDQAQAVAEELLAAIRPYCLRAEIAGSIRRRKPFVRDIEICAIPRWSERPSGFFDKESVNELYEYLANPGHMVVWIKPGTNEIVRWHINPEGKYWRGLLPMGMKLDLFLPREDNWGIQYVIRTGSADFSKALVTHALRIGMPCDGGYLTQRDKRLPTVEESDVFDLLGLQWVEPKDRHGAAQVRRK